MAHRSREKALKYDGTGRAVHWFTPDWMGGGWTIREVKSEHDLRAEGQNLVHSLGDDSEFTRSVLRGDTSIFSLRDADDVPHLTIEIKPGGVLGQWCSRWINREPHPEYRQMVNQWLRSAGVKGRV